jgi:hypothetical protein
MRRLGPTALLVALLAAGIPSSEAGAAGVLPTDAIGRLLVSGQFVCTAFVIRSERVASVDGGERPTYRNWVVTAGHCVIPAVSGGKPTFLVAPRGAVPGGHRTHPLVPAGFSGGRPWGYDVGVFVYWTLHPVPILEPLFNYPIRDGEWLLAAGFSRGVLSYSVGRYQSTTDDLVAVDALLSQGSSGGPVVILGTRNVIGIVAEGTLKQPAAAAGPCIFVACATERPYFAVPIDWVLRVMRW